MDKVCPLCKRDITKDSYADEHHLIPKSKGGKETITLHRICHSKIHSIFRESELKRDYYTIEKLLSHEEIIKFVKWVSKKNPSFHVGSKRHSRRR